MEKLMWLIKNQIITPESTADGMGGVRTSRLEKSVAMLSKAFDLPGKPTSSDVFTTAFLPPLASRKLP
jgi:NitT/TauT family transport system substrate-binding protein